MEMSAPTQVHTFCAPALLLPSRSKYSVHLIWIFLVPMCYMNTYKYTSLFLSLVLQGLVSSTQSSAPFRSLNNTGWRVFAWGVEVPEGLTERIRIGWCGGGVEKWENGSSGNSEEMRANRSYVSMETVTIIEISIPGWGWSLTQITVENHSMSGEPDRIPKSSMVL